MVSTPKLQKAVLNYQKSNPDEFVQCEWVSNGNPCGMYGTYTIHNNGFGKTYWRFVFNEDGYVEKAVGPIPTCFIKTVLNTNDHKTINKWRIKMLHKQINFNKYEINVTKKSAKSSIQSFNKQIKGLLYRCKQIGRRN